jgi:hypothetical protein
VEFNAKVSSTTYKQNSAYSDKGFLKFDGSAGTTAAGDKWRDQYSLQSSFSRQKSSGSSTDRAEFSLYFKVVAEQDDMPVGMSRILGVLEESISTDAKAKAK